VHIKQSDSIFMMRCNAVDEI